MDEQNQDKLESQLMKGWVSITSADNFRDVKKHLGEALMKLLHLRENKTTVDEVPPNENANIIDMISQFEAYYGKKGVKIISALGKSQELNGKLGKEDGKDYYEGFEYSFPLMLYGIDIGLKYMQTAGNADFNRDQYMSYLYKNFVNDVELMFKKSGRDPETEDGHIPMPSEKRVRKIANKLIKNLIKLANKRNADSFAGPPLPDVHPPEG